jgi:DNA polymerase-3 subunit delta'
MIINKNWNMLGHQWAVDLLKNSLSNGRIRHAYLFTGPMSVGKRTLALRFAQAINCLQPVQTGQPCGECRSCQLLERMQHPDLSIVQAEVAGGILRVDQVRDLQHTLSLTPYEAKFRVALILRFEEANQSAANALLKSLEEPPPKVIMLLTANEPEALLPTIVSRCELIRLRPLSITDTAQGLQKQYGLSERKANLLAHISDGRPGYALKLHQDPEILDKREAWLVDHERLLSANRVERIAYADAISKDKETAANVLQIWSSLWRDILLATTGSTARFTNIGQEGEINTLAAKTDSDGVVKMIKAIDRTRNLIQKNVNTRMALEVLLFKLPFV